MRPILLATFCCMTALALFGQTAPAPPIVNNHLTALGGGLVEHPDGRISDITFEGMETNRTEETLVESDYISVGPYRVELRLADGRVVTSYLSVAETSAPYRPFDEARERPWAATFLPMDSDAKEIRIYNNQDLVFSQVVPEEPFPYTPKFTQVGPNTVKVEPAEIEFEVTCDGGKSLEYHNQASLVDGIYTIEPRDLRPGIKPIFMADVVAGLRRYTAWLEVDPNFVPPPPQP